MSQDEQRASLLNNSAEEANVVAAGYDNNAHSRMVHQMLSDVLDGDLGDLPGVRRDSPAQVPLAGGELCCYWGFNILISLCTAFLLCCCGIFQVEPMTAVIFVAFGKIIRVEKQSGLHFTPPLMIERESVNLNIQTMQVMGSNVPDSTGSPMNVSSIVNFVIDDPVASKYNVENYRTFIHNQAYDVVRRICSRFRYRS